jgi:hypothetical protein
MNLYTARGGGRDGESGAQRVREVRRDWVRLGLVSQSINANYPDGQTGLFKLVSFHQEYIAQKGTRGFKKTHITFPEFEKGSKAVTHTHSDRDVKLTIHLHPLPRLRMRGAIREWIQKFPDWVDNEVNNNNKHWFRSNKKGYGGKIH